MKESVLNYLTTRDFSAYKGVAIVGSYATGKETKWSDVDLIFIVESPQEHKIEIIDSKYYTSTFYTEANISDYFKNPELIMNGLLAFSEMKIIYDPLHILSEIKEKSSQFKMTSVHIEHAKYKAARVFISYIEEASKALQGLKENHVGKMVFGLYGLSYGMFEVIRLRDQIMVNSDNAIFNAVYDHLNDKDPLKELSKHVFNLIPGSLEDQVDAGLEIFIHISNTLMAFFTEEEKDYIIKLVQEIIIVI